MIQWVAFQNARFPESSAEFQQPSLRSRKARDKARHFMKRAFPESLESVSIDNEYEYENESISYSYSLSFL